MKNALLISHGFPPMLAPESILMGRMVKYLPKFGWEGTVVTAHENYFAEKIDMDLLNLIPERFVIQKTKSFERGFALKILHRLFPCLLHLPDTKILWFPFAYKIGSSLLREGKFDLIYSHACSFTSNLVGLKLKEKTGLPWIAHFSDPWVDNPYHTYNRLTKAVNFTLENSVMQNADAIVFVSDETMQLVMCKYPPEIRNKSYVIPHCYDPELFRTLVKQRNDRFTLTYTGSFYGARSPVNLLRALKNILTSHHDINNEMNVKIVGNLHKSYVKMVHEFGIDKIVSIIGRVSYFKSLEYILNADVLLLIDAPSKDISVFLPLKLIDYIGSKNPILGITPIKGASASLIRKVNGIVVDPDDINGIERAILLLYSKFKSKNLSDYSYGDDAIEIYKPTNTTESLSKLFDQVSQNNKREKL